MFHLFTEIRTETLKYGRPLGVDIDFAQTDEITVEGNEITKA